MHLFRRTFELLLRRRGDGRRLAGLLVLMFFGATMEAVGVGLIMPFIALLQDPGLVERSRVLMLLASVTGVGTATGVTMVVAGLLLATFVVKNIYLASITALQMRFVYSRMTLLSQDLLAAYLSRRYPFFLARNSAELVKNVVTDPAFVFYSAMPSAFLFVIEGLTCVVLAVLLVALEPIAVPVVALFIGGGGWLFQRFFRGRSAALGAIVRERELELVRRATQAFGGIKEVRIRGCEPFIVSTFGETSRDLSTAARIARVIANLPKYAFETLAVAGMILVSVISLARGGNAQSLVPVLGVLALAVVRLMPSAVRMLGALNDVRYWRATVEALHLDLSEREAMPVAHGPLSFERELRFDAVHYTYPGADREAIVDVSLSVRKGEAIAIVGSSGAGKTTFADILIGLLEPSSGTIHVDDVVLDGDGSKLRAWQLVIGYVPQHVYLCDDTLRRNIAFGVPDAEIDEERLARALETARLSALLRELPQGLDTSVGERGVRLSGGQQQRIGIARALYFDPKVLVLDEATSALDGVTEAEVVAAIEAARADRTTIVIAHRLSTVRSCDRIIYMEGGRIVSEGTWDSVVKSSTGFRRLVELGATP